MLMWIFCASSSAFAKHSCRSCQQGRVDRLEHCACVHAGKLVSKLFTKVQEMLEGDDSLLFILIDEASPCLRSFCMHDGARAECGSTVPEINAAEGRLLNSTMLSVTGGESGGLPAVWRKLGAV